MAFSILTDTSANLPTELLKTHGIAAVPFSYYINEKEHVCTDTRTFNGQAYYDMMRKGQIVTTSQINPEIYADYMEPILKSGNDLLFIGMSSGISGSFNAARLAVRELQKKYPQRHISAIDTLGASLGEGLLVLKAEQCKNAGLSLIETETVIRRCVKRMYQVFIVDDLMHLKRSGRLAGAIAIVGTLLHVKPLLKGNEKGEIVNFSKIRGRRKAIMALAEKYDALVSDPASQTVGIAHADCEEDARYLAELLRRNNPPMSILTVCYEPVTGAHVGPGTLALFFMGEDNVRGK